MITTRNGVRVAVAVGVADDVGVSERVGVGDKVGVAVDVGVDVGPLAVTNTVFARPVWT